MLTEAMLISLKEIAESLHCLATDEDATTHQKLYMKINGEEYKYLQTEGAAEAIALVIDGLASELHRLANGPLTLAEAIASGRPFRRKGRPIWVKPAPFTEEGPQWLHQRGGGDWEPYLVDTATGWLEEANEFNSDDITTTDYELMPEGGGEE